MEQFVHYIGAGLAFYLLVGIVIAAMWPAIIRQGREVGRFLPDSHVRYVVLVFFFWPGLYWIFRYYQQKIENVKLCSGVKDLADFLRQVSDGLQG